MMAYIGDLSRADATLLQQLAARAARILEFGCGASTQLFAAYGQDRVESVETDPAWIAKTERHLAALPDARPVVFHRWESFRPEGPYDLIFNDGIDRLREAFAFATWPHLQVGGVCCFHDTRRTRPHGGSATTDVQNVCALVARHAAEIERVELNREASNITVVTKRAPLPYEDWNVVEGRSPAQIGLA